MLRPRECGVSFAGSLVPRARKRPAMLSGNRRSDGHARLVRLQLTQDTGSMLFVLLGGNYTIAVQFIQFPQALFHVFGHRRFCGLCRTRLRYIFLANKGYIDVFNRSYMGYGDRIVVAAALFERKVAAHPVNDAVVLGGHPLARKTGVDINLQRRYTEFRTICPDSGSGGR